MDSARRLTLLLAAATACAPAQAAKPRQEILISGADYTFVHPDTIAPGPTTIRFTNTGHHPHEMSLGRLKPGFTLKDVIDAGPKGDAMFERWAAILITEPGDTVPGSVNIDLVPGATYILWCGFRDSAGAPEHATLGMAATMQVR